MLTCRRVVHRALEYGDAIAFQATLLANVDVGELKIL